LTKLQLLKERKQMLKKKRALQKRSGQPAEGIRIRGRWVASRQTPDHGVGASFDGSQGVDAEDILNIPEIGFGSFQLFPDQNTYGFDDPTLDPFENTVQIGLNWIQRHAEAGRRSGKPVALTGFGLVTQRNAPSFVPVNTTVAPFRDVPVTTESFGVTETQRDDAYTQWLGAGISGGLQSMLQYQWGQSGMTAIEGTTISPIHSESGQSPIAGSESGQTPNDGYSIQGVGEEGAQAVLRRATSRIG
jgi:mannan endo-1,4-beta-mannosidase